MKKFVSAVAVLALVAFAAPALAATNPFMDVPMNHWAYDAIGQLAAHGILSGYPDGTYKGKQPTTRYEMASALARALAVVDMTKASRQDVEMLQKLVVEFHDELEALGVTVADLEGKVNLLDKRLGGWKISGYLWADIENAKVNDTANGYAENRYPTPDSKVELSRARIIFDKWWGEDDQIHFHGRINGTGNLSWQRFYVEMPFFFDSKLTVGKNNWDIEGGYYKGAGDTLPTEVIGGLGGHLADTDVTAFQLAKQFGLGTFRFFVAHPELIADNNNGNAYSVWELGLVANMQFTEAFGFDLGLQYFAGDNSVPPTDAGTNNQWTGTTAGAYSFDKLWTIMAGLHFNFTDAIAFKAIYFGQKFDGDVYNVLGDNAWHDVGSSVANGGANIDDAKNWRVILSVGQDALKFTDLWIEYGQADKDFAMPTGGFYWAGVLDDWKYGYMLQADVKYYRIIATQQWNEKWKTALVYNGYDWDDYKDAAGNDKGIKNIWGIGVDYAYTPEIHFGLGYLHATSDTRTLDGSDIDRNVIRFRTTVSF